MVKYSLSSGQTGLMFMVYGFCYTVFTPLFGFLMDRGLGGLTVLTLGNSLITIGFIFTGPIPQLDFLGSKLLITGVALGKVKGATVAASL